jgi:hypothetical protein
MHKLQKVFRDFANVATIGLRLYEFIVIYLVKIF